MRVDLHADRVDAWSRERDVKLGSCWVVEQDGKLQAFSTACPHLGCAVDYEPGEGKFKCPCHRSAFTAKGEVEVEGHVQVGPVANDHPNDVHTPTTGSAASRWRTHWCARRAIT